MPTEGVQYPTEASYGQFPVTSRHMALQKVRGTVVGFTGLQTDTFTQEIILSFKSSQGAK